MLRYNLLLRKVRVSIHELKKGIAGFVVISEEQESVMQSLSEGKVSTRSRAMRGSCCAVSSSNMTVAGPECLAQRVSVTEATQRLDR